MSLRAHRDGGVSVGVSPANDTHDVHQLAGVSALRIPVTLPIAPARGFETKPIPVGEDGTYRLDDEAWVIVHRRFIVQIVADDDGVTARIFSLLNADGVLKTGKGLATGEMEYWELDDRFPD